MPVVCIDVDSLRADHVGKFGYSGETTPNIDALCDDGVWFRNAHAANSPCMPSRAALMSGRFGVHNGIETHGRNAQVINFPATTMDWAGSWTEGVDQKSWWTLPELFFKNRVRTVGVSSFPRHPAPWFYHVWHEYHQPQEPEGSDEKFQTPRGADIADRAIETIDSTNDEFFLYVQLWDPHGPYNRSDEEIAQFRDVPLPEYPTADQIERHQEWKSWRSATQMGIGNRDDLNELVSEYDAEIRYADRHIGRLINYLKNQGIYDETLIVLTADHGEEFGEHGLYREHWSTHDGTQRIPLVLKPPSDMKCVRGPRDQLITNVDLAPTIADYADLQTPTEWQGTSLRPIVETPEYDGREFVVVDHGLYTAQRAIRTEQWKLIRTYHSGMWERVTPEFQLYNMNTDPMEQTNLANKRPDTVNTLRGKLLEWVDRHRNISEDALLRVAKDGPAGYNAFVDEFGQA